MNREKTDFVIKYTVDNDPQAYIILIHAECHHKALKYAKNNDMTVVSCESIFM